MSVTDRLVDSSTDNNQRFHWRPEYRLLSIAVTASMFGFMSGFYEGYNRSSLIYLAENSHRLPRTVGGWYFYHKRKNYVCIKNGINEGVLYGVKITGLLLGYFGFEAFLDQVRGDVDFLNTTIASGVAAGGYAKYKGLNNIQTKHLMGRGLLFGLASGLVQDGLIFLRGGKVWYVEEVAKNLRAVNKQKTVEQ